MRRVLVFLLVLPLVAACSRWTGDVADPREVYGFSDAGFLRPQVDAAIAIANDMLDGAGSTVRLRSSWTAEHGRKKGGDGRSEVLVYLVRQPVSVDTEARLLQDAEQSAKRFWNEIGRARLNEAAADCRDADDCVEAQYPPEVGRGFDALYDNRAALEIAVQQVRCNCIVLFQGDLERFDLIFGRSADQSEGVPLVWHLPMILLHELGHSEQRFSRPALPGEAEAAYRRMEAMLTAAQREEVRADAFVAAVMRKRCFTGQKTSWDVSQSCMAAAAHGIFVFMQDLFGKSKEGLCRRYLPASATHPSYMLRQLALGVVIYPENPLSTRLLVDFLDTQDKILAKDWIDQIDVCHERRAYYAKPALPR